MSCRLPTASRWGAVLAIACCSLLPAGGCMVPASRLASCRAQYQQLSERNKSLQTQLANLNAEHRQLSSDLNQSESELIALDNRDRRRAAFFDSHSGGRVPPSVSGQLAALAARYPSLHFDPRAGVAKLDADVLFATGDVELQPRARQLLKEFAAVMETDAARDMRLMVVGHTDDQRVGGTEARALYPNNWHLGAARALAVTDFLRAGGLREDRIGISTYGRYQPVAANDSLANRQRNRRVELFLLAPDVPVVGWTETFTSVYR